MKRKKEKMKKKRDNEEEKAAVRGGVCRWENPVYETVKFVREPKTGKFNERLYHFVVSTVWSLKFSVCGWLFGLLCVRL